MKRYSNTIIDTNSAPISNASVKVLKQDGTNATIYSDSGVTVTYNPTVTDVNGAFEFYIADGIYDLQASKTGYSTQFIDNIVINEGGIASIAELRAMDVTTAANETPVYVQGFTTPGDGGGGTFYWNSTDTTADNGVSVIAPDAGGTGRWNKIINTATTIGPNATQQHTLPAVASDTVALLAASQTLTNKTISGGTLSIAASSTGALIYGTNAGTGQGVRGDNTSNGTGVYGTNSSTGPAVYGYNTGTGIGVQGYTSSTGPAVYGYSTSGDGGWFNTLNVNNALTVNAAGTITAGTVPLARMQRGSDFSGTGTGTVMAAGTTLVSVDLGTVTAGDRILVTAYVNAVKGATAGNVTGFVYKSAGTSTVVSYVSTAYGYIYGPQFYQAINSAWLCNVSGIIQVTVSGTLTLSVYAASAGSDSTAGEGALHAIILKGS